MKRTSQLIRYAASIILFGVFLPSAFADEPFYPAAGLIQPVAEQASWQDKGTPVNCDAGSHAKGKNARSAHGFNILGRLHAARCGNGDGCPDARHGLARAMCCGAAGAVRYGVAGVQGAMYSGQPLIDPWARADWMAAQQAATRSWHAGYYNTQWGVPLALMAPPQARTQTRWGRGVAQSTMLPLYHQYKRPYPGPVASDETGTGFGPLLPTPRWPSHTDQFGVYYIRGPW